MTFEQDPDLGEPIWPWTIACLGSVLLFIIMMLVVME